ncbi:MAG: hypothetical protein ABIQ35_11585 [Verrucomicrobiota bacterium]
MEDYEYAIGKDLQGLGGVTRKWRLRLEQCVNMLNLLASKAGAGRSWKSGKGKVVEAPSRSGKNLATPS